MVQTKQPPWYGFSPATLFPFRLTLQITVVINSNAHGNWWLRCINQMICASLRVICTSLASVPSPSYVCHSSFFIVALIIMWSTVIHAFFAWELSWILQWHSQSRKHFRVFNETIEIILLKISNRLWLISLKHLANFLIFYAHRCVEFQSGFYLRQSSPNILFIRVNVIFRKCKSFEWLSNRFIGFCYLGEYRSKRISRNLAGNNRDITNSWATAKDEIGWCCLTW